MSKTAKLLVTIPFDSFIEQIFGDEKRYYIPLEPVIAEVIEYHIKNSKLESLYKIQYFAHQEISRFTDYKETKLKFPRLWIYSDWYDSSENYNRRKAHSIRDREEAEMLARNVKLVSKHYRDFTGVDNIALSEAKAYALIKGNKLISIKMLGVNIDKLITDKSQL